MSDLDIDKLAERVSRTTIGKYGLVEDAVNLRLSGMSLSEITSTLNAKLPEGVTVTKPTVHNFFKNLPEVQKKIVQQNKRQLTRSVNNSLDMVSELTQLYNKSKKLLDDMEADATHSGYTMSPYKFKAVSSELRETLKLMMEVHKEISDLENISKFMNIVIEVIKEEAPQSIPIIIERLKMAKGTGWLSEVIRKAEK